MKVPGFTLQEMLVVLCIIGIASLIAIPSFMPVIGRFKSSEAQMQLKYLYSCQTMHRYSYSKFSSDMKDLAFEAPKTINQGGTANYVYEILESTNSTFKATATAVTDFNGDGTFSVWEIDETGVPKEKTED